MKYYCEGCNIQGIGLKEGRKHSKKGAEGNRYCAVVHAKLTEYCPCHECVLMVSCSTLCGLRLKLRNQSFDIISFRLAGRSDADTM